MKLGVAGGPLVDLLTDALLGGEMSVFLVTLLSGTGKTCTKTYFATSLGAALSLAQLEYKSTMWRPIGARAWEMSE